MIRDRVRQEVVYGKLPEMTWGDAMERYVLTVIKPKTKPERLRNYLSTYARRVEELGQDTPLQEITRQRLVSYRGKLLVFTFQCSFGILCKNKSARWRSRR